MDGTAHFTAGEFACRCGTHCNAAPMNTAFLDRLERLRVDWGRTMIITSGRRCALWNTQVGGSKKSHHLLGRAVDVFLLAACIPDFVLLAEKFGMNGIGIGTTFVHIDDRAERRRWTYGP